MNKPLWKSTIFQRAEFLSANDLLQRAGAMSVLFLAVHLAGFREFTGVLNGTIGSLTLGWNLSAFLAVVYILLYLAFVILVPVLIIAAIILTIWQRFFGKSQKSSRRTTFSG
ncbi:MAG: hypothetical protein WBW41_13585 [Verrucomicrobiia bacterium]